MKTKRTLAMLLASMMVMSMATLSVSAEGCPNNDGGEHTYTGATCTTPGTCVCGETGEIDSNAHDYGNWVDGVKTCNNDPSHKLECNHADKTTATCTTPSTCNICGKNLGVDENAHSFTGDFVKVGDTQHKQKCANCEEYNAPVDCDNTEDTPCTGCGRAATGSGEPDPQPKTQIAEVIFYSSSLSSGNLFEYTITSDEYSIDYAWYVVDNSYTGSNLYDFLGEEIENPSDTPIDDDTEYYCIIEITPEEGYTLGNLATATEICDEDDWNYNHSMSVSDDVGKIEFFFNSPSSDDDEPSSGSGSSSGSSSTPSNPSNTKAGIINAKKDEKITVTTKNNEVSKDYIAAAAKSKATLVVNYEGYTWEISDVKEAKGNINLSINKNAVSMVDVDALKDISGDSTNIIDIAHDGELGFKGTLKYNVKKENAGKFLNLYYYNPTTKKLELQGSTKIAEDGSVKLPFTHCSTYVLNITDKAVATTLFEDLAAGEAETTVEAALPSAPAATTAAAATDAAANPSTGNSAVALAVIPVAIMAAAVIAKKK